MCIEKDEQQKSIQKSLFMPHHRAKDTRREKNAVQLHSARNKTKLTAPAAAQCAGQKQGITEQKVREREGERESHRAPTKEGAGGETYAHTLSRRSLNAL